MQAKSVFSGSKAVMAWGKNYRKSWYWKSIRTGWYVSSPPGSIRNIATVSGVNRVLWDISEKPVATIEFE